VITFSVCYAYFAVLAVEACTVCAPRWSMTPTVACSSPHADWRLIACIVLVLGAVVLQMFPSSIKLVDFYSVLTAFTNSAKGNSVEVLIPIPFWRLFRLLWNEMFTLGYRLEHVYSITDLLLVKHFVPSRQWFNSWKGLIALYTPFLKYICERWNSGHHKTFKI